MFRNTWQTVAVAASAVAMAFVGFGSMPMSDASPSADEPALIHACYHKNQGQLRYIDSQDENWADQCRPPELALTWNQQGIQGEKGDTGEKGETGATGPQGEKGETGATGATGPAGADGVSGLAGQSCASGAYVTGFADDGTIVCSDATPPSTCSATTLTHTMSALKINDFDQAWRGGEVTLGTPDCNVTLKRPSGSILLIGTTGDAWEVTDRTGFGTAVLTVNQPNCESPLAISNVTAGRPSCSSAFTGFPTFDPVSTASVSIAAN